MDHENNRAGAKEEKRFKSGMGEKMKHRGLTGGEPDRHHHVTELREGGVGENAFDVVLLRRHQRRQHCGDRADPGNDMKGDWRGID